MAQRKYVTKKKVSGTKKSFRKWGDWDEGDVVLGKYIGIHEDRQYDKQHVIIEVEEAFFSDKKLAKSLIGQNLVLNSCGSLDKALEQLTVGDIIQCTYNGMGKIESGKYKGKEAHSVEVEIMGLQDEGSEEQQEDEDEEDDGL